MTCNDRKLIASQTGEQIAVAHCRRKPLSDNDEDVVTDRVSIDVIDPLKSVQVERQHRMSAVRTRRRSNCFFQDPLKLPAVCEAGQCVRVRQFMGAALGGDPARDLALLFEHAAPAKIDSAADEKDAEPDHLLEVDLLVARNAVAKFIFKDNEARREHRTDD